MLENVSVEKNQGIPTMKSKKSSGKHAIIKETSLEKNILKNT